MKLAVFRAEADGRRTARALAAKGHEAVLAPVIAIVPLPPTASPGGADAVVFTSAHGPTACSPAIRAALAGVPCFCVGGRTAAAAAAAGFGAIRTAAADASELAATIIAALPRSSRIAVLAGHDRKSALEDNLTSAGYAVAITEIYTAAEADAWPPAVANALAACNGALHYSRRSTDLAMARLWQVGLMDRARAWDHYCLSADVAGGVRAAGCEPLHVAASPNEAALLVLL